MYLDRNMTRLQGQLSRADMAMLLRDIAAAIEAGDTNIVARLRAMALMLDRAPISDPTRALRG